MMPIKGFGTQKKGKKQALQLAVSSSIVADSYMLYNGENT